MFSVSYFHWNRGERCKAFDTRAEAESVFDVIVSLANRGACIESVLLWDSARGTILDSWGT